MGEVFADDRKEAVTEFLQFAVADAVDLAEFIRGRGVGARHVAEGDVAKDDVGRQAQVAGKLESKLAQGFKEGFVAGQIPDPGTCGGGRGWGSDGSGQKEWSAFAEEGAAFVGEGERGKQFTGLP